MTRTPLRLVSLLGLTAVAIPSLLDAARTDAARTDAARTDAARPAPPSVRLRLSGQLEGRLEPCGCAGGQLGGLARRSFTLQQDRRYDVLVEGGNLTDGTGSVLEEEKLITTLTVLADLAAPYDAVAVGPADFALDTELLGSFFAGFEIPLVTSDLVPAGGADEPAPWPGAASRTLSPGPGSDGEPTAAVHIASLTRLTSTGAEVPAGLQQLPPQRAWTRAIVDAPADALCVLLVHGADVRRASAALAGELEPRPDLVVGVGPDPAEPLAAPEFVAGHDGEHVPVVFTGTRGRFLVDVALTRTDDGATRVDDYAVIPLSGSKSSPGAMEADSVVQLLLQHRHNVAEADLLEAMARQHPTPTGAEYIGDATCAGCHATAHATWSKSPHADAWQTLVEAEDSEKYGWPVTQYPDCVSCHVVGYGEVTGFVNAARTPGLRNVACETCHGPGSKHLENPMAGGFVEVGVGTCTSCHDYEQSPDFEWRTYWAKIAHGLEPWMQKARAAREGK